MLQCWVMWHRAQVPRAEGGFQSKFLTSLGSILISEPQASQEWCHFLLLKLFCYARNNENPVCLRTRARGSMMSQSSGWDNCRDEERRSADASSTAVLFIVFWCGWTWCWDAWSGDQPCQDRHFLKHGRWSLRCWGRKRFWSLASS